MQVLTSYMSGDLTVHLTRAKDWPHAPIHRFDSAGTYMVTAATLDKELLFLGKENLNLLESSLLSLAKAYQWGLQAWAFP